MRPCYGRPHFLVHSGFFEIFGKSARTRGRGVGPTADILRAGMGDNFRDFVRTSFMDGF